MATYGSVSRSRLETVDPRLVSVLEAVIAHIDHTILCGSRGRRSQNKAKHDGRSTVGWPDSKHNCPIPEEGVPRSEWREDPDGKSKAVDIAPWFPQKPHIRWDDLKSFAFLAGQVIAEGRRQGVRIRWLGDADMDGVGTWADPDNRFLDMPHFEIVEPR